MAESCMNCHFGRVPKRDDGTLDFTTRECKIDRPRLTMLMTPKGPEFVIMRPRVPSDDWCGEWKARDGSEVEQSAPSLIIGGNNEAN